MSRSSISTAAVIAAAALVGLSSNAHATCAVPTATYVSGLFGTDVVTASSCFDYTTAGGSGVTAGAIPLGSGSMAASADLSTGILTAYSASGLASAALWDTFTFSGLPTLGETVAFTLSLSGTLSGTAFGVANIQAGPSAAFEGVGTVQQGTGFGDGMPVPASISVALTATDASSLTVSTQILADGSPGNIADLTDPPTLTVDLPAGVTATSASGVFTNFEPLAAVPEPGSAGLLLAGLWGLVSARHRWDRRGRQPA
jgi:hypothetical protein